MGNAERDVATGESWSQIVQDFAGLGKDLAFYPTCHRKPLPDSEPWVLMLLFALLILSI